MNKSRISALLFAVFAIVFLIVEFNRIGDFKIFLLASEALGNNENIYSRHYIAGFRYFYSPLFAILIYPLTLIPEVVSGAIWNLISFMMLGRTFWLIQKMFLPDDIKLQRIYLLSFAAAIFPIYTNFHHTQMSAFMLYSIFECIYQVNYKKQKVLGAGILALAINVKILPIVFIPYFIYRKEFRVAFFTIFFLIIYLALPGLIIGNEFNSELVVSWWKAIDPLKSRNIIDVDEKTLHSLTSLFSTLFTDQFSVNELTLKRNILTLDETVVSRIINIVRLVLIFFTFYFLRTWPFRKQKEPLAIFWEVSYICLLIPLIFPHQQTYGFLLLFPAIYYLIFYFLHSKPFFKHPWKFYLITALGLFAFLIINLELLLGLYRELFWHYKTLTYGAILLLIALALSRPSIIEPALEKPNVTD
ncbi:MAG: DUF2029 domain-containing protein [Bacteroidales bacterium]|nr:DUF2029 domain-containing protein [Bacteroidales bacterium]